MQHLAWTRSGRLFSHADEGKTDTFTWKSSLGQRNVDLGGESFAPYALDLKARTLQFADCELRFKDGTLEFRQNGELLNTLSLRPEIKGLDWSRKEFSQGDLSVTEIDGGGARKEIKVAYTVTTEDMQAEISVMVGGSAKAQISFRLTALKAGEQQLAIDFAEAGEPIIAKVPSDAVIDPGLEYVAGVQFGKSWWRWRRDEVVGREAVHETASRVTLGQKAYAKDEVVVISPDAWGADVGITENGNDGYEEQGSDNWGQDGYPGFNENPLGGYSGMVFHTGLRWGNITIPKSATINTAYIDAYVVNSSSPTVSVFAWAHDNAPQFNGTTYYPSAVTKTSASVNSGFGSTGWVTTPNLASVVQEIVSRAGWSSGNALNFIIWGGGADYAFIDDYSKAGENQPQLTITYTAPSQNYTLAAGGGSFSVTGTDATLKKGCSVTADAGSYSESGSPANLKHNKKVMAGAGAFTLFGAAALRKTSRLDAASRSFAETGTAAILKTSRKVAAESTSITLAGQVATLRRGYGVAAGSGNFSMAGSAAAFRRTYATPAEPAGFLVFSTGASLEYGRRLQSISAALVVTGAAASLRKGTGLPAGAGSFSLAGMAAAFRRGYLVQAGSGTFLQDGPAAALKAARKLPAGETSYDLAGSAAGLKRGMAVSAGVGAFTLTCLAAGLRAELVVRTAPGEYLIEGAPASLTYVPIETYKRVKATIRGKAASVRGKAKSAKAAASTKKGSVDFEPL
jgi:hypothetical protein